MKVLFSYQPGTRFHATASCRKIRKVKHRYKEVSVDEVGSARPCAICLPEYPRVKVIHRRCRVCNRGKVYPCSHNGGVRVVVPVPSRGFTRVKHVWPEHAHLYEVAEPAIRV